MRLLPFIVLLAAAAVDADKLFPGPPRGKQQDFGRFNEVLNGYLPPKPSVCLTATVTRTSTSVFESTRRRDVTSTRTQTASTTVLRTQVVPTTILRSSVITRGETRVETVVQTRTSEVVRSAIRTVTAGGVTRTVQSTVLRTQQVRSTAFDTQTSTAYRDIERVVSSIVTRVQPTTITRREEREETRVVPFRPPPVIRTDVRTSVVQSTAIREGPGRTIQTTVVVPRTITSTVRYQPPGGLVTRTATTTRVAYRTQTTTIVSQIISTRQRVNTRTSVVTQVRTETRPQVVTRVSTQLIPTTVFRTQITTQVRASTVFNTRTETRTVDGPGRVRTSTYIESVVSTVTGQDRIITRSVVSTNVVQRVSSITQRRGRTTTITRTQQQECGRTTYNYDAPSIAFNLPN